MEVIVEDKTKKKKSMKVNIDPATFELLTTIAKNLRTKKTWIIKTSLHDYAKKRKDYINGIRDDSW